MATFSASDAIKAAEHLVFKQAETAKKKSEYVEDDDDIEPKERYSSSDLINAAASLKYKQAETAEKLKQSTTADITVYVLGNIGGTKYGGCPFCQKVLFCLNLHKLKYEMKFIDPLNKPQYFLDLNKVTDGSFKLMKADQWKASVPVFEDRKHKVRIFDSGEACNFLETNYGPAVLSKNEADINKIPAANKVFGDFFKLLKDVASRNNGVINDEVDKSLLNNFKTSLREIDDYLGSLYSSNDNKDVYLNGTSEISLLDIQFIPKAHLCVIHSENALNINIANDKSGYKNISKYMNFVYKQDYWKKSAYENQVAFEIWKAKFGLNWTSNNDEEEKKNDDENTGFYVIPETPEMLYTYLKAAMSLELSTLPLYLTAHYSFIDDNKLSATAKDAKKLIREIIMEEMLHMNLLSNIISSIYGVDKITTCFNIPYGKGCKLPANIRGDINDVSLRPFCKQALYATFIQIEAPTSLNEKHQPIKLDDGSIRYPFEPEKGSNEVTLTFIKKDHLNQIGEFYNAIEQGLKILNEKKLITFTSDDKQHKQRQCKSRKSETDSIVELQDALDGIDVICTQGEGYELKEGVFASIVKNDGDDNKENDEKTHFIKFIELLVGRKLEQLKVVKDSENSVSYKFIYENEKNNSYKVDFDKEVYPADNFKNVADDALFNVHYQRMLEKLTAGLKVGDINHKIDNVSSVDEMRALAQKFKICMEKKVYPNFAVPQFPTPPDVALITSNK